ncbi:response regulator transcription factor [Rhodoligotrophos defluvii]|uniref:response regulator transcription factor n=1 Tax=Rhodoligotrophos defluvii TaxID=2561934 RepID=UPI0010C98C1F|nr:response regulator transcription factor [Rhodoligotrophos defluvii]
MAGYHFIIADDHPLFRDALRHALTAAYDGVQVKEAGSLDEVTALLEADDAVDLLLLDLKMPGVQGLAGLAYLRAQFPDVPTVVVSATEDLPVIRRAVALGASGFIPKSTPVSAIREAVREVLAGGVWLPPDIDAAGAADDETDAVARRLATLTPQQVRVLMMLREGLLNKQIAYALGVSEATVKAHVSAVLQKLGVESRTQAVIAVGRIDEERGQSDPVN